MSADAIRLKELMAEVFECDVEDITDDSAINETVGWDSLNHINLMLQLEQRGVAVAPLQIPDLTSYEAIRRHIDAAGRAVSE